MIIIIRALTHVRKKKEAKEAKKKREKKKRKEKKRKKRGKKREGAMLLSFYHTCASK